jgi:hypothetical protein
MAMHNMDACELTCHSGLMSHEDLFCLQAGPSLGGGPDQITQHSWHIAYVDG